MTVHDAITQAANLNHRLQHLFSGRDAERIEEHAAKAHDMRHLLSTVYWQLIVEHHQAMLHLVESNYHASAFALLRSFEEAFLRSFVAMYGTDRQVAALWDDKYNAEFEVVGEQIAKKLGSNSKDGLFLKDHIKILHSLTHGGKEQLVRFMSFEPNQIIDISAKFSDDEVLYLVMTAMLVLFWVALFTMGFWGYTSEQQTVRAMFDEYLGSLDTSKL